MAKTYIRKLQKSGSHSYVVNIPKEVVDEFGWQAKQKLEITFGGRKPDLSVKDWDSNDK